MLFNSYIFILFFLPITLIGYFLLNKLNKNTWAKAYLLGMSLWFYGYFNYWYLAVILSSIVVNYFVVYAMRKDLKINKKFLLFVGLLFDVGLLFYFKYFDFFIENVNWIFRSSFNLKNIVLPLGISFFTFQQISYVVDAYRGETNNDSLLDYAVFVTFFPQLIAGPIVTHDELIPQIMDKQRWKISYENLSKGLYIFAVGLFKKVIVADTFGGVVDWGFEDVTLITSADTMIVMLSYTFQIYFDFSAYSDMAIGIGKMFNFELPINFNSPYKAYSITEFWQRWHMTLTRFLRKYIYFPLGGNRKGKIRTYLNIMVVYMVSGLWHGAAWTFVLWGFLHGIANVLNRIFKEKFESFHKVLQWGLTFCFINVTWLVFRAESITNLKGIIKSLLTGGTQITSSVGLMFKLKEIDFMFDILNISKYVNKVTGFYWIMFLGITFIAVLNGKNLHERDIKLNLATSITTVVLLIWGICSLSGVMTFLYFNF